MIINKNLSIFNAINLWQFFFFCFNFFYQINIDRFVSIVCKVRHSLKHRALFIVNPTDFLCHAHFENIIDKIQHLLTASEIRLQKFDRGIVITFKVLQILQKDFRTCEPETINSLFNISNCHKITIFCHIFDDSLLHFVCVLIFINEDIFQSRKKIFLHRQDFHIFFQIIKIQIIL